MREYLLNCRLNRISPELLESAEKVVKIAMEKLKGGYFRRGMRRKALLYAENMRIYELTDAEVFAENTGEIHSVGNMKKGLFISGIQLDREGYQLGRLKDIELPRDPLIITPSRLFKVSFISPVGFDRLANELNMAQEFDDCIYPRR